MQLHTFKNNPQWDAFNTEQCFVARLVSRIFVIHCLSFFVLFLLTAVCAFFLCIHFRIFSFAFCCVFATSFFPLKILFQFVFLNLVCTIKIFIEIEQLNFRTHTVASSVCVSVLVCVCLQLNFGCCYISCAFLCDFVVRVRFRLNWYKTHMNIDPTHTHIMARKRRTYEVTQEHTNSNDDCGSKKKVLE